MSGPLAYGPPGLEHILGQIIRVGLWQVWHTLGHEIGINFRTWVICGSRVQVCARNVQLDWHNARQDSAEHCYAQHTPMEEQATKVDCTATGSF